MTAYGSGIDPSVVRKFAKLVALRPIHRGDVVVPFPHYRRVGDTARDLVNELLPLCSTALDTLESVDEVRMAGWLLHAFDCYGCVFDDLLDNHVPFSVATAVAEVSVDMRLPQPRRVLDRRSRVSQAGIVGQLIVFSELLLQAEWLQSSKAQRSDPAYRENLKMWLDEHSELLLSLHALRELPTVDTLLNSLRESLISNRRRRVCQLS